MPSSSSPVYKQQKNSLETKWISLPSLSENLVNWELLHKYCPCWTNETLKQMDTWLNGPQWGSLKSVCVQHPAVVISVSFQLQQLSGELRAVKI